MTPPAADSTRETAIVENLAATEDLLDWLEAQGFVDRKVVVRDDSTFLVTWLAERQFEQSITPRTRRR